MLRLAAELRPQLWLLRRNAGGAGVEMALAGHVAAQRDQDRRTEGKLISTQQRRDKDVACRRKPAIGTKPYATAQAVEPQQSAALRSVPVPTDFPHA